jgi:hypothetical protein
MRALVFSVPAQVTRPVGLIAGPLLSRAVPAVAGVAHRGDRVRIAVQEELDRQARRAINGVLIYVVSRVDLVEVVQHVDVDIPRLVDSLDVKSVLEEVDLVAVAQDVIDGVDLPGIIRASSASVGSEAVRGVRVQGIEADRAITRAVDHLLHRHRDVVDVTDVAAAAIDVSVAAIPEQPGPDGG